MDVEIKAVNVARLLSELEGSYALMKSMGFTDDMETLRDLKGKYHKLYNQLKRTENNLK